MTLLPRMTVPGTLWFSSVPKNPGTKSGLQSTFPDATTGAWPAGAYVALTNIPLSASRIPLFGTGDLSSFTGTPDDVVVPAGLAAAVKPMPVSVSTTTPAAVRTVNVVDAVERLAPAPADESRIVAAAVSSHERRSLLSVIELAGDFEGPRADAASARYLGSATGRASVWPARCRRALAFVCSPVS